MSSTATEESRVRGRLGDEHGSLPLTGVDIESEVCELVATTVVRQTFRNTRQTAVEATYVFPLPDRAGVTAFVADLAGRVVEGRLAERERAREEYDEAITAGHRAALAEEDRPGVFTTVVGNLLPGEEAAVTLTMTGPVPVEDGYAEYRFPLVVAPRYVPGTPLPGADVGSGVARDTDRVPDASRITPSVLLPGQESPVRLSLSARLRVEGLDAAGVTSSLHDVTATSGDDGLSVQLRPGERLDRDVLLRWQVTGHGTAAAAVFTPDSDTADRGTWQVTVVPPADAGVRAPRDVLVVLDRSGSMTGWKIVAARRAAARIVDTLDGADRFAVLAFDHAVERPPGLDGLAPGTDQNRWTAVSWLAGVQARGGTEMLEPLTEAVRLLDGDANRDRFVLLVTDGQVANEDEIVRALAPAAGRARVFSLGIDQAVNAAFLRRIAAVSAGRCDLVESEERLDDVVAGLHRRIGSPVATGLAVAADGLDLVPEERAPERAPDLFAGVPVALAGRWRGTPSASVRFTIRGDGLSAVAAGQQVENPAVRTIWARARVRDLEDRYAAADEDDDALADQIAATSLAHGVLSRFTAFVAVDRERTTGSRSPQPVFQPVELPSGWSTKGLVGAAMPMAAGMPEAGAHRMMAAPAARVMPPRDAVEPEPYEFGVDPYRPRIEELLRRVDAGTIDDLVVRDLDRLADDLASVGAPDALVDAVRRLATAVRERVAVAEGVADLRAQLGSARRAPATRRRRGRFWRR